jgi:hypothetical protein
MDFSNLQFKNPKDTSKPPLSSSRYLQSFRSDSNSRPSRRRTESYGSSGGDSRAISASPSRVLIPLSLVSSSNVSIPITLQQKLKSSSNQRRALASILQKSDENTKILKTCNLEKSSLSTKSSKVSLKLNDSKDHLRTAPLKECTFGPSSAKENNYVNLYYKHKKLKEQLKGQESVVECIRGLKEFEDSRPELKNLQEMDSDELEKRYLKITDNLDKIARNIQMAINGGKIRQ